MTGRTDGYCRSNLLASPSGVQARNEVMSCEFDPSPFAEDTLRRFIVISFSHHLSDLPHTVNYR